MRNDIIEKIRVHLTKPVHTEAEVVYLLVEIRKILEDLADGHPYPSLRFHCDWALHTKLSGTLTRNLLQEVEALCASIRSMEMKNQPAMQDSGRLLRILDLSLFRDNLRQLLHDNGLPTTLPDDWDLWVGFLAGYFKVVEDCPLICTVARNPTSESLSNVPRLIKLVISTTPDAFLIVQKEVRVPVKCELSFDNGVRENWSFAYGRAIIANRVRTFPSIAFSQLMYSAIQ
ncbi:MAG: hypothetical protein A3G20_01020 [Acidobacteria bacterium RIFCSPLOWO2_12_FULL_59_11]|nr:MAG: hypothetical protein A3G20_01020 [Acidobacteria bacterium RIFCSPLOWO2_12_FULL_59_11]